MAQRTPIDVDLEEHLAALRTVRSAARFFGTLAALTLTLQIIIYSGGRYGGWLQETPEPSEATTTAPTTAPSAGSTDLFSTLKRYRAQLLPAAQAAFPAMRLLGFAGGVLLAIAMLLATGVSLAGRLGGARSLIIGFFHALIVVMLLCPWDRWLPLEGLPVSGALSGWHEIAAAANEPGITWFEQITESVRFFGLPGAGLVFLLAVALRFRRGFLFALERVDPEIRVRVV